MLNALYLDLLYIGIIVFATSAELLPRVNTARTLRKIAMMLIILGAWLALDAKENPLIASGVCLYFFDKVVEGLLSRRRRKADKIKATPA